MRGTSWSPLCHSHSLDFGSRRKSSTRRARLLQEMSVASTQWIGGGVSHSAAAAIWSLILNLAGNYSLMSTLPHGLSHNLPVRSAAPLERH